MACIRDDADVVDVGGPERVRRMVSLLRDEDAEEDVGEVDEGRREKKRMVG
jgi:hypothetical protein